METPPQQKSPEKQQLNPPRKAPPHENCTSPKYPGTRPQATPHPNPRHKKGTAMHWDRSPQSQKPIESKIAKLSSMPAHESCPPDYQEPWRKTSTITSKNCGPTVPSPVPSDLSPQIKGALVAARLLTMLCAKVSCLPSQCLSVCGRRIIIIITIFVIIIFIIILIIITL